MNRFQEAIDIQDACNPVAVAGVLHKQMVSVLQERQSTGSVLRDDAVKLILFKLMDMCPGLSVDSTYYALAYRSCQIEAKQKGTDEHPMGPIAAAGD